MAAARSILGVRWGGRGGYGAREERGRGLGTRVLLGGAAGSEHEYGLGFRQPGSTPSHVVPRNYFGQPDLSACLQESPLLRLNRYSILNSNVRPRRSAPPMRFWK
jgi:hypothetical protein